MLINGVKVGQQTAKEISFETVNWKKKLVFKVKGCREIYTAESFDDMREYVSSCHDGRPLTLLCSAKKFTRTWINS